MNHLPAKEEPDSALQGPVLHCSRTAFPLSLVVTKGPGSHPILIHSLSEIRPPNSTVVGNRLKEDAEGNSTLRAI